MYKLLYNKNHIRLNNIIKACQYLLDNFPEAQPIKSYLDSRLNKDSQNLFQFGYIPNIYNIQSLTDLVGEETLYKQGLLFSRDIEDALSPRKIKSSYFEDFPLILPFKDAYGKIAAIVGRSILSDNERKLKKLDKYKNTRFQKSNFVFGLYENKKHILDQNVVFVVEGQFDVIKAAEKGFRNVVALGSSYMSIYQYSIISRYTNNINLLLDNDESGEKGRKRIIDKFGKYSNIQNFYVQQEYKDIDEYLTKSGDTSMSFSVKI